MRTRKAKKRPRQEPQESPSVALNGFLISLWQLDKKLGDVNSSKIELQIVERFRRQIELNRDGIDRLMTLFQNGTTNLPAKPDQSQKKNGVGKQFDLKKFVKAMRLFRTTSDRLLSIPEDTLRKELSSKFKKISPETVAKLQVIEASLANIEEAGFHHSDGIATNLSEDVETENRRIIRNLDDFGLE